eukprot:TRINITY_DN105599_c0_g1_i1.p1 TRINITY_DN105599_c0_g1~~TRINITY_DN105599_c0_g1_i1.p1  ORF type:complete len:250 (-),score=47.13 TRINITY_DN105599_c0_g1_i1:95-799(-)
METPMAASRLRRGKRLLVLGMPALVALHFARYPDAFLPISGGRVLADSGRRAMLMASSSLLLAPNAEALDLQASSQPTRKGVTPNAGLQYEVLKEGSCDPVRIGDLVRMKHKAYLGGFGEDSTTNPFELTPVGKQEVGPYQQPVKFKLGKVPINKYNPPALTDAFFGMRIGEKRRVTLPPEYAFGKTGRQVYRDQPFDEELDIPPNQSLYYEIELTWSAPAQVSGCGPTASFYT